MGGSINLKYIPFDFATWEAINEEYKEETGEWVLTTDMTDQEVEELRKWSREARLMQLGIKDYNSGE